MVVGHRKDLEAGGGDLSESRAHGVITQPTSVSFDDRSPRGPVHQILHSLLPPPPTVGRDSRWAVGGDLPTLQDPGDLASLARAPNLGRQRIRGTEEVGLHLSPTNLAAHASARSQTSKNVKHVDALSGGRGRDGYRRPLGRGLLPPRPQRCTQSHPHPPPGWRQGGTQRPAPPPRPSPGAARGAAEDRAPAGLGGEPLAGGPADFLLISSRKPAPCAPASGSGARGTPERSAPPARPQPGGAGGGAARQHGREGTPGFLGRCQPPARRWNFEPEKAWCFSRAVLLREEERSMCWGLWGGARSWQSLLPQVCRVQANFCRR